MQFNVYPSSYSLHILYLIVIFKYPLITTTNGEIRKWIDQCKVDYNFCPKCFRYDDDDGENKFISNSFNRIPRPTSSVEFQQSCYEIENNLQITNDDIIKTFNNLFGMKKISFGNYTEYKNSTTATKVVIKYLFDQVKLDALAVDVCEYLIEDGLECAQPFSNDGVDTVEVIVALQRLFLDKEKVDGCTICPTTAATIARFSEFISNVIDINDMFKWILINLNVQPLLLSILNEQNFNVPKLISSYGFITIEENDGATLYNFYDRPIEVRLLIAKNLLKATLKLTEGVGGFRIYLTDINPDNVVVDSDANYDISFIDLDSSIILDSNLDYCDDQKMNTALQHEWKTPHVHEKIDCKGCFAYVPKEICQHHISDLNIFSVCQLLHEDLFEDTNKGLLHSMPTTGEMFINLRKLLNSCLTCHTPAGHPMECNRFDLANQLIKQIEIILLTNLF